MKADIAVAACSPNASAAAHSTHWDGAAVDMLQLPAAADCGTPEEEAVAAAEAADPWAVHQDKGPSWLGHRAALAAFVVAAAVASVRSACWRTAVLAALGTPSGSRTLSGSRHCWPPVGTADWRSSLRPGGRQRGGVGGDGASPTLERARSRSSE